LLVNSSIISCDWNPNVRSNLLQLKRLERRKSYIASLLILRPGLITILR
jgi:hypothetical protein